MASAGKRTVTYGRHSTLQTISITTLEPRKDAYWVMYATSPSLFRSRDNGLTIDNQLHPWWRLARSNGHIRGLRQSRVYPPRIKAAHLRLRIYLLPVEPAPETPTSPIDHSATRIPLCKAPRSYPGCRGCARIPPEHVWVWPAVHSRRPQLRRNVSLPVRHGRCRKSQRIGLQRRCR